MKKAVLILLLVCVVCAGTFAQDAKENTVNTKTLDLEQAIADSAKYLAEAFDKLPRGSSVAVDNFSAPTEALSDYILKRLVYYCSAHFTIIDRRSRNLELRERELDLSDNMEIDQDSEQERGHITGIHSFIDGSIVWAGDSYLLEVKAFITRTTESKPFQAYVNKNDRRLRSLLEQKPFRIMAGARAGVSPHFWTLSNDIKGDAKNPAIGFEPAVQGAFYFTDLFALQTEIALSIDNVFYSGKEADGTAYTASFESLSLRVPLLARFTFRPGIFVLSPFGGVCFNIPLGDMKLHSSLYDDSSYRFLIPPGYVIGVNAGMKLGPGILFADARFSGDFAKTVIKDNSGTLALYTRNTLSFSLGYEWEFPLNRQK